MIRNIWVLCSKLMYDNVYELNLRLTLSNYILQCDTHTLTWPTHPHTTHVPIKYNSEHDHCLRQSRDTLLKEVVRVLTTQPNWVETLMALNVEFIYTRSYTMPYDVGKYQIILYTHFLRCKNPMLDTSKAQNLHGLANINDTTPARFITHSFKSCVLPLPHHHHCYTTISSHFSWPTSYIIDFLFVSFPLLICILHPCFL